MTEQELQLRIEKKQEAISMAGGYNQDIIINIKHGQILHYRVLVNII